MQTVTLALNAMATRFEIVLQGEDAVRLRAAGEEALAEIERLEAQLSLYRPTSEIARLNAHGAQQPVRLSRSAFQLLKLSTNLSHETKGCFDITIAPLVKLWGFMGKERRKPTQEQVEATLQMVGAGHLMLNKDNFTAQFDIEGAMVDLGAIGKGYAIDQAAAVLRDAGVSRALIHGGTSTVYALGAPFDAAAWKIAVDGPPGQDPVATIDLRDSALSVSATWGKSFTENGKNFGHIIDPRTGWPAEAPAGAILAAVVTPLATESDALSTALLVLGAGGHDRIAGLRSKSATFTLTEKGAGDPLTADSREFHTSKAFRAFHRA